MISGFKIFSCILTGYTYIHVLYPFLCLVVINIIVFLGLTERGVEESTSFFAQPKHPNVLEYTFLSYHYKITFKMCSFGLRKELDKKGREFFSLKAPHFYLGLLTQRSSFFLRRFFFFFLKRNWKKRKKGMYVMYYSYVNTYSYKKVHLYIILPQGFM